MDQTPSTPPTKDDVLAILKAHRDLGPEFDNHLADQILDLWHHGSQASGRRSRLFREAGGEKPARGSHTRSQKIYSVLALSIPLLAIAGGDAHIYGVLGVLGLDALAVLLLR